MCLAKSGECGSPSHCGVEVPIWNTLHHSNSTPAETMSRVRKLSEKHRLWKILTSRKRILGATCLVREIELREAPMKTELIFKGRAHSRNNICLIREFPEYAPRPGILTICPAGMVAELGAHGEIAALLSGIRRPFFLPFSLWPLG